MAVGVKVEVDVGVRVAFLMCTCATIRGSFWGMAREMLGRPNQTKEPRVITRISSNQGRIDVWCLTGLAAVDGTIINSF